MKKFKFVLPAAAFVFTIAVSFASVNFSNDPSNDYVINGGTCQNLDQEIGCAGFGNFNCQVTSASLGGTFDVYDGIEGTQCVDPKLHNTNNPFVID